MADSIRWGRSILGWPWLWHAIDEHAVHPIGCYKAECGHLLLEITELHEAPTTSSVCQECAAQQYHQALEGGSP